MGYIKHHTIVVTGWQDEKLKKAHQKAKEVFDKYCDYVEVSFGGDDEHERIVRSKDTDLDAEDGLLL